MYTIYPKRRIFFSFTTNYHRSNILIIPCGTFIYSWQVSCVINASFRSLSRIHFKTYWLISSVKFIFLFQYGWQGLWFVFDGIRVNTGNGNTPQRCRVILDDAQWLHTTRVKRKLILLFICKLDNNITYIYI